MSWFTKLIHDQILTVVQPVRDEIEQLTKDEYQEYLDYYINREKEDPAYYEDRISGKTRICSPPHCQIYAEKIMELLQKHGFNAKYIQATLKGKLHAWAEIGGDIIVDITADQFGEEFPPIVIGPYKEWPQYKK